ncbi:MAG: SDR family NAD(P)-dependent oxidoreductase [Proteobacteria bacterium]|nr:SDR family NAD(P)-dependent oxidoreductase [Pseudomonadota bacterium]
MTDVTFKLGETRALVTGASSGLGPWIVKALDRAGARVAIQYHTNHEGAARLAGGLSREAPVLQAELSRPDEVEKLFASAAESLGHINLLVNCAAAASQSVSDLKDMSLEGWQSTQQANVDAPMQLIRAMAAQGRQGVVLNVSSIEASRPAQGHSHYAVSKAALEMLTRAAALEFGPIGLRVNAIAPGLIWRDGIETGWPEGVSAWQQSAPLGKLVDPGNIADAVLFLASDSAASITGTVLTVDCGLSVRSGW